jgi:hypothetical protein
VGILRNSFAFLAGNTITFGPRSGDQAALQIGENSAARMVNNTVEAGSSSPAIGGTLVLFRDASATLRGGNTIRSTGTEAAVQVIFHSSLRQDIVSVPVRDVFEGSRALETSHLSYLDVREVQVTGDTKVDLHSLFKVGSLDFGGDPANIGITGDITVSRDSTIEFVSASTAVNGNIKCTDTESSISLPPGSLAGINTIDCSGFRQVPARPEQ